MKTFIFLMALFTGVCAQAQVTLWQGLNNSQGKTVDDGRTVITAESDSAIFLPEAWDENLDKLLNSWHIKHYTNKINHEGYKAPDVPVNDSVYVDRLAKLPKVIELPYNDVIRTCIDAYVNRRRGLVEYMLGLESLYFPMIEETLDKYGLPLELKYLTIVESALNPVALSKAGASGLWQFMLPTGKLYGLEINSLVDERLDPYKSTDAACRFFTDLYKIYGDWNLAIAAYNCGAGNVNKAIKRAKGKTDYWEIYPYLPRETRSYVPLFIAVNYVMNYYPYHQLYPVQVSTPTSTDTIMVSHQIHFDQVAEILQMDKEEIRALNPQYKRDIIPGNSKPQVLKLPSIQAYAFVEREDSIATYKVDELFPNRTYVEKSTGKKTATNGKETIVYRVKSGESLVAIGHKYGVSTANIRKWNGLKSNKVAPGRKLTLYADNGGYALGDSKVSDSNAKTGKVSKTTDTTNSVTKKSSSGTGTTSYRVKSGDSLSSIARKYPGYTYRDLMKLNNLDTPALKEGQYIRVPKI
jgi:membrane-bound lytic murein transglycosylase D